MPEGEQGMNVARIAALRAGLPVETSAMTINRFCSSGLQRLRSGRSASAWRGGNHRGGRTESMSMVPMGGNKFRRIRARGQLPRRVHQHGTRDGKYRAEIRITREAADAFAATSHKKAVAAIAAGAFKMKPSL